MPIYNTVCSKCFKVGKIISDVTFDKVPLIKRMCKCGYCVRQLPTGPTTKKMEILDNGVMPRAIERLADAERIMKDRVANADSLAGKKNFS